MSPTPRRRQGLGPAQALDTRLEDIVLRDGKRLAVKIGDGITGEPLITRTIEGASSIEIPVHDPDRELLDTEFLRHAFEARIDGLWFSYVGLRKSGPTITIVLEDREVRLMRQIFGPRKAYRDQMTRAEFIVAPLRRLRPRIDVYSPELHLEQPIARAEPAPGSRTGRDAGQVRAPGFEGGNLTVKGVRATAEQKRNATIGLTVADELEAPYRAVVALIMCYINESLMQDLGYGDRDSQGILQVRVGLHDVDPHDVEAVTRQFFLEGYTGDGGGAIKLANAGASIGEIAGRTLWGAGQTSYPGEQYIPEARRWVDAWTGSGGVGASSISDTVAQRYQFEQGRNEDLWSCAERLVDEVNWRRFMVAGRFFLISEADLFRQPVAYKIDPESRGVDDVDFDFDQGKPVTEVTVTARIKDWPGGAVPGSVVALAGYGVASQGDYFPPPSRKERKFGGLDDAREVAGRYLVSTISTPLDGHRFELATISLKKPMRELPEPAPETRTVSRDIPRGLSVSEGLEDLDTPLKFINYVISWAQENGFPHVTPESVRAANAVHGPTISGGRSDHQGPPDVAWAADISNGSSPTPEMAHLAAWICKLCGIPWSGAGLVNGSFNGMRIQVIYKTDEGGDHFDHVHAGAALDGSSSGWHS